MFLMAVTLNGVQFGLICYFNAFNAEVNKGGSITALFFFYGDVSDASLKAVKGSSREMHKI